MKVYNYHINLYKLYKEFGESVFFAKEMTDLGIVGLNQTTLRRKAYFNEINRREAEKLRPEIKSWLNTRYIFRILSKRGLEISRYLDDNQDLIAKKILNNVTKMHT